MILKNSIKAAMAAAALTLSISGANAQYYIVPPVFNSSVTTLPYGGYYGPVTVPTPSINYGVPDFNQTYGYDLSNYGYNYGYAGNGYYGPDIYNGIGGVNNAAPPADTPPAEMIDGTIVHGGIVDPTKPAVVPPADEEIPDDSMPPSAAAQDRAHFYRSATSSPANLVTARRGPYNRVAIAYKGDTNGVADITMMLLDGRKHEVQEAMVTSPPAQTLLRRPAAARYYRVVIDYYNGAEQTITRPLNLR